MKLNCCLSLPWRYCTHNDKTECAHDTTGKQLISKLQTDFVFFFKSFDGTYLATSHFSRDICVCHCETAAVSAIGFYLLMAIVSTALYTTLQATVLHYTVFSFLRFTKMLRCCTNDE
jgi:hypothetical protein